MAVEGAVRGGEVDGGSVLGCSAPWSLGLEWVAATWTRAGVKPSR